MSAAKCPLREEGIVTCRPLSFGNVGTPLLPVLGSLAILLEALLLLGEILVAVEDNHGEGR